MKLSKNFTLDELTSSNYAKQHDIENYPNEWQIKNLVALCENVLQPIRDYFQTSIIINSGFRSKKLNIAVGGVSTSHHCCPLGFAAADIRCNAVILSRIFKYIQNNLVFCQLIWEKGTDSEPDWIHVSFDRTGTNKKEVLKLKNGKYIKFRL